MRTIATAKPDDTNAGLELVTLLGAVKGNDAARDELLARIKAGPGAFAYQIALAKLDFAQGKAEASQKLLQQLIAEAKSREDALTAKNTLATLYMSQNNVAAAEPLIAEVIKEDARNTLALRLRAAIHLERNQIDDAIADLRSALNDQPRSPELLQTLGAAYRAQWLDRPCRKSVIRRDESIELFTYRGACLCGLPTAAQRHLPGRERADRTCQP